MGEEAWTAKFLPQLEDILETTMLAAWGHVTWTPGAIGMYGFDIMPDEHDNLWLLEVNKCPSMEEDTPVTSRLVPQFMEDFCRIAIDGK